jgi:hypothetical protein
MCHKGFGLHFEVEGLYVVVERGFDYFVNDFGCGVAFGLG